MGREASVGRLTKRSVQRVGKTRAEEAMPLAMWISAPGTAEGLAVEVADILLGSSLWSGDGQPEVGKT